MGASHWATICEDITRERSGSSAPVLAAKTLVAEKTRIKRILEYMDPFTVISL
jgi:hypothetical protein